MAKEKATPATARITYDGQGKQAGEERPTKDLTIDQDELSPMLDERKDELDAAHKEQTSLTYDVPKKSELSDAKDIAGEAIRGVRGLFKRKG